MDQTAEITNCIPQLRSQFHTRYVCRCTVLQCAVPVPRRDYASSENEWISTLVSTDPLRSINWQTRKSPIARGTSLWQPINFGAIRRRRYLSATFILCRLDEREAVFRRLNGDDSATSCRIWWNFCPGFLDVTTLECAPTHTLHKKISRSLKLAFHDADTDTDTDSPNTATFLRPTHAVSWRGSSRGCPCRCRRRGIPVLLRLTKTATGNGWKMKL